MRVIFSDRAIHDLTEIGDYIAADNPRRAGSFVRKLRTKALYIGRMPRAFPLLERHETTGIRRRAVDRYLIFYRIDDDRISIIHVLHGARDFEALLFPQG